MYVVFFHRVITGTCRGLVPEMIFMFSDLSIEQLWHGFMNVESRFFTLVEPTIITSSLSALAVNSVGSKANSALKRVVAALCVRGEWPTLQCTLKPLRQVGSGVLLTVLSRVTR